MNIQNTRTGKIFYCWPSQGCEESLRWHDPGQLGNEPYDVVIVGAGLVGCALAYKLSQYRIRILLIDKNYDVGEGTSKANSALLITGFDTEAGSLESRLVTEASAQWPELTQKLKIPYEQCGCLMAAIDAQQHAILMDIHKQALANHVEDVEIVSGSEAQRLEPNISQNVQSGFVSPREAIGDPFMTSIAFAEVALANGVDILLGLPIVGVEKGTGSLKNLLTAQGQRIRTRIMVNVAGLGSRQLADQYGGSSFDINPRRGQFLVFDKSCRALVSRMLFPVPTPLSRGILIIPTVYGGLLAGPTAEELAADSDAATDTSIEGRQAILSGASRIFPTVHNLPIIGAYAGARCHCKQGSYFIRFHDGQPNILTVTGIRSTGFSACITLADYLIEGLSKECNLTLKNNPDAVDSRTESSWPGWWRKRSSNEDLTHRGPDYRRMICFCENISRGEIIDALNSPLRPRTLSSIKRRSMAHMGRCQGFDCRIRLAEIISEHCGIPLNKITQHGPGSECI